MSTLVVNTPDNYTVTRAQREAYDLALRHRFIFPWTRSGDNDRRHAVSRRVIDALVERGHAKWVNHDPRISGFNGKAPAIVKLTEAGMIEADPLHGVCWPMASNGDESLPWVEKDDDHDRFADDIEAATYVAELIGSRVMWAPLHGDPQDGSALSPFVLPPAVLKPDLSKTDGGYWADRCGEAVKAAAR